jgi:hypothetical protein
MFFWICLHQTLLISSSFFRIFYFKFCQNFEKLNLSRSVFAKPTKPIWFSSIFRTLALTSSRKETRHAGSFTILFGPHYS